MIKLRLAHVRPYRYEEEVPGQILQIVRLRIKSGAATSGPPIGPVLGQYAIPISRFCTEFNERTSEFFDLGVEVFVTLYYLVDGSYKFDLLLPISSICFRRAARIKKSTGMPRSRHDGRRRSINRRWRRIGAISQYMLFEIIQYISEQSGITQNVTMHNLFSKCVGTLRSVGIIPYYYGCTRSGRRRRFITHSL